MAVGSGNMEQAGDVFSAVAAFLDDPEQDVMTDDYLRPFLNIACQRLFEQVYANPNINGARGIVVLPNVDAGTTNLAPFMEPGKPLSLLSGIFSMREKPTGTTDDQYRPMRMSYDMPIGPPLTASVGNLSNFNCIYIPIMGDILLPGASQALDFRIYGEFRPQQIKDKDSLLIPGTSTALQHWTTELVALTRGATDIASYHKGERVNAVDAVFNSAIMHISEVPVQQRSYAIGIPGGGWTYFQ